MRPIWLTGQCKSGSSPGVPSWTASPPEVGLRGKPRGLASAVDWLDYQSITTAQMFHTLPLQMHVEPCLTGDTGHHSLIVYHSIDYDRFALKENLILCSTLRATASIAVALNVHVTKPRL